MSEKGWHIKHKTPGEWMSEQQNHQDGRNNKQNSGEKTVLSSVSKMFHFLKNSEKKENFFFENEKK